MTQNGTMETETDPPAQSLPRLAYSLAEGAAVSGLSQRSLYRLIAAGKLHTVKRGGRRLVPRNELERLCGVQSVAKRD